MARQFLDSDGVKFLATQLLEKMDLKINTRIVTSLDDLSTNDTIPGTKAVFDLITSAIAGVEGVNFDTVVGPIGSVSDPSSSTIYLQKDDEQDSTWAMYVHVEGEWIDIGTTEVDLSGYWAKADLEPISNAEIQDILDELFP